jgi:hypothetical protein
MIIKNIQDVCLNVILIPRQEKKVNESTYSLLKKSSYFETYNQITVEAIRQVLLEHPDCIDDWIQYSEDQRCHPTWFFRQDTTDYEVGFVSLDANDVPVTKYQDRFEACATFIKNKFELVRQIP